MKKLFLLIPILFSILSLSSCIFNDDEWKKDYGTPELFIQTILSSESSRIPNIYLYENTDQTPDDELKVASLISEAGPFESVQKKDKTVARYFTYEAYWKPATSGPNYCNMSIWDDGYIVINNKKSIGRLNSVYFSMDSAKALELVDYVFDLINEK